MDDYFQSEKYKEALDHYKKRINQLADKEIKSRRAAETTASLEKFEKNSSINEHTDNIRERYKSKLEKQLEAEGDYKYSITPPASSKPSISKGEQFDEAWRNLIHFGETDKKRVSAGLFFVSVTTRFFFGGANYCIWFPPLYVRQS